MAEKLTRFTDVELSMIADSSMFKIGRAFTHMGHEQLTDAQEELAVLGGVLEVLRARH